MLRLNRGPYGGFSWRGLERCLTGTLGKRGGTAGTRDELRDEPVRKCWKIHVDCELTLSGEQDGGPDGSPVNRRKKGSSAAFGQREV